MFGSCLSNAMSIQHRREALRKSLADGFLDNESGDKIRCIDDPFALALACLRRRRTLRVRAHLFDIGDGLLEDVAEHADRHVARKVIVGDFSEFLADEICKTQSVDDFVPGEKPAIVGWDFERGIAFIHGIEKSSEIFPSPIRTEFALLLPSIVDQLCGQQRR